MRVRWWQELENKLLALGADGGGNKSTMQLMRENRNRQLLKEVGRLARCPSQPSINPLSETQLAFRFAGFVDRIGRVKLSARPCKLARGKH